MARSKKTRSKVPSKGPSKATVTATERISFASSPDNNNKISSVPSDLPELPTFMNGLEDEEYFHGLMLKDDGAQMLKTDGDFVVLTNEILPSTIKSLYILVYHNQEVREVTMKANGPKYCFNDTDGMSFDSVVSLIKHYKCFPIMNEIYLRHGIPRNDWELLHQKIEIKQKCGEGTQANVQRGVFHENSRKHPLEVAIKIHKGNVDNEKLVEIMHEIRILLQLDHDNVVRFVGVALLRSPLLIVLELVHGGGLNRYLKIKKNEITTLQRICMCADAANGLEYVHSLGIIHRDVASRNCLYSQSKQRTLISDFGLSHQEDVCTIDPSKPLPIRWLAPEVMSTYQCSKMTDVWSYGVLCWEIFNDCKDPYSTIKLQKDVIDQVVAGTRLEFSPENVPKQIIDIILRCWDISPEKRPTMKEIVQVSTQYCEKPQKNKNNNIIINVKKENSIKTKKSSQRGHRQPDSSSNSNRSGGQKKNPRPIDVGSARNRKKKSESFLKY